MNNLEGEIKEFALSKGADLVGIAPVSRFDGVPDGHKPEDILADAKTVIACAKRIPNAVVIDGPATSYHVMMDIVEDRLDWVACEIAIFVEQQGGLAIPVTADGPYYDWDAENLRGRGDLSHKHAAEAAGLGRLGKNSLLITPEFGNRVQLVSVVTNLDLEPDPLIEKRLCPLECDLCIESCPVQAIVDEQRVIQKLCRPYMFEELPRGTMIESCRECRKVCLVGVR